MFGIKRKVEGLRADFDMIYHETLRIRNLFTRDRHGTARPKVDLLCESFDKTATDIFIDINRLNKRMDKLEAK